MYRNLVSDFDYFLIFPQIIDHFMNIVSFSHWLFLSPNSNCLCVISVLNTDDVKHKLESV